MRFLKTLLKKFLSFKRKSLFKNKTVLNKDVTILSNCCIGGAMYHDLGLQFNSPTINLFFGHHSFINFVKNIKGYSDATLYDTGKFDVNENGFYGPICLLKKEGLPAVEIHFLHYRSFDEASEAWNRRFRRINFKKIFLVIEAKEEHEHQLLLEYISLKYPKVIFTNKNYDFAEVVNMPFYKRASVSKSITGFCGVFGKRGYDDYNFVDNIFNKKYWG